jgi:hypothetical protein
MPRDQGTRLDSRITVLDVPALPIEPLPGGTPLNRLFLWRKAWEEIAHFARQSPFVLGIGCPGALPLAVLRRLRPAASFYDAMDDFPEFHRGLSRRAMRRHEEAIVGLVDLVIASSTHLTEKFAQHHLCVEKILNAGSFGGANGDRPDLPERPDQRAPTEGWSVDARCFAQMGAVPFFPCPPVLGYVGCLGSWFDWPLVTRLAEAVPEVRVELVGPCEAPKPRSLPANVRVLAACAHAQIPHHLARFSAGLIPFVRNRLTAGVDPIKYYDYRAYGLPVLTTRFGEMALRGVSDGVYFLDHTADLRAVVLQALANPLDAEAIDQFRATHNWQQRFATAEAVQRLFQLQAPLGNALP